MEQTIIDVIYENYISLTKSEKKIADYVLQNRLEAQYMSIVELSSNCRVAESTISLFCRKLKLGGFYDFKLELAKAAAASSGSTPSRTSGRINSSDTLANIFEKVYNNHLDALLSTYHLMNEQDTALAADILVSAERVLCLGQGSHSIVAKETGARFSVVSSKFYSVEDVHLQVISAAALGPQDAVIYYSYSGATREFLELAKLLKQQGVRLILVTHFKQSPGNSFADALLLCGTNENPLLSGSVGAVIAQLYILDVLYEEFCRRMPDETHELRERVSKALSPHFV